MPWPRIKARSGCCKDLHYELRALYGRAASRERKWQVPSGREVHLLDVKLWSQTRRGNVPRASSLRLVLVAVRQLAPMQNSLSQARAVSARLEFDERSSYDVPQFVSVSVLHVGQLPVCS